MSNSEILNNIDVHITIILYHVHALIDVAMSMPLSFVVVVVVVMCVRLPGIKPWSRELNPTLYVQNTWYHTPVSCFCVCVHAS